MSPALTLDRQYIELKSPNISPYYTLKFWQTIWMYRPLLTHRKPADNPAIEDAVHVIRNFRLVVFVKDAKIPEA